MKKLFKNLIVVLTLTMLFGTTCFAEEKSPQIYVDGYTVAETAALFAQSYENEKATKPALSYSYSVCSNANTIVIMTNDTSSGSLITQIISVVFNPIDGKATSTVTTVANSLGSSNTVNFPMNIEVR